MGKHIAIVGSSGGNLYTMGGKDPKGLLGEIVKQVHAAGMEIGAVQFIAAEASMDFVKPSSKAHLWSWKDGELGVAYSGTLEEVNKLAQDEDKRIADMVNNGEIDGFIFASADPDGVNNLAIKAAAEKELMGTGSGGTSMAKIQSMGLKILAVSGTTGTTNRTRAIANVYPFSKAWKLKYRPAIGSAENPQAEGSVFSRISLRGILMASLPGFIAMALMLFLGKIPGLEEQFSNLFSILIGTLPVIVATIAAWQVSGMGGVAIVSGVIAGALSVDGGIIGGIFGGILAGILVNVLFNLCLKWRFPVTTANIVAGGIAGLAAGLVVYFLIAPLALWLGNGIRSLIDLAVGFNVILAGAVAGLLIWPAIMGGVYHAAILPIILLEMEVQGNSFFGAIDMCGLVMVSAGITLANIIYPRIRAEASVAVPGFLTNMLFGTFVEAAYPFMFSDKLVFGGALFAAMLSGAFVGIFNVRGTAYVPSLVAPSLSNSPLGFVVCMAIALVAAFLITILANRMARHKDKRKKEKAAA